MQADLAEDSRLSLCTVNRTPFQYKEVTNFLSKYVVSLTQNIDNRFQDALPLVSSFFIYDSLAVPPPKVEFLGGYYYPPQTEKEKLQP